MAAGKFRYNVAIFRYKAVNFRKPFSVGIGPFIIKSGIAENVIGNENNVFDRICKTDKFLGNFFCGGFIDFTAHSAEHFVG